MKGWGGLVLFQKGRGRNRINAGTDFKSPSESIQNSRVRRSISATIYCFPSLSDRMQQFGERVRLFQKGTENRTR